MKNKIIFCLLIELVFLFNINSITFGVEQEDTSIGYSIGKWAIDFFIVGLGDLFQATIDSLQTYAIDGAKNFPTVTYSEDEVCYYYDIKEYINIYEDHHTTKTNYKIKTSELSLDKDAEFPLVVVDAYSLAVGKVAATDINFLKVDQKLHNNKEGLWEYIRKLSVALMRATLYVCAAALISSFIYNGIIVVGNIYKSPDKMVEHKESFNKFVKSVIMLALSVLIMSMLIYVSKFIIRSFFNETDTKEFPIQIEDENTKMKFSTNITGYFRYKCQSVDLKERVGSAFVYLVLSISNFILGIFMIVRFLILIGFSIYGIICSVIYIIKKEDLKKIYMDWGIKYSIIVFSPIIIAIFQKMAMEVSCN